MTGSQPSKANGTQQLLLKLKRAKRPALTLLLLSLLPPLTAACMPQTLGTVTSGPMSSSREDEQKARCAGWRGIEFSAASDTPETIHAIQVHNRTGLNKRCPRFKR